ncbi:hypothetical protein TI05_18060, partial [Achromatium sp. WMS3]
MNQLLSQLLNHTILLVLASSLFLLSGCSDEPTSSKGLGSDAIPQFQAATTPGKKLALLVGVRTYAPNSGISSLKYADRDMHRLQQALIRHNYTTRILLNEQATRGAVLSALKT